MPPPKMIIPNAQEHHLSVPKRSAAQRQQRVMMIALALLLGALTSILYRERDFWFPDSNQLEQADDFPPEQTQAASAVTGPPPAHIPAKRGNTRPRFVVHEAAPAAPPPVVIGKRTVLPPLEVEVVAGDARHTVRPGSNAMKVDVQSQSVTRAAAQPPLEIHTDPPVVPTNAAERARVTPVAANVVAESIRPDYPMLARQMKVQGSVILQALIGRDGLIQNLQVLSGPPILAKAAREAVQQWQFKPHYVGNQTVETQTRITVNFTISTN